VAHAGGRRLAILLGVALVSSACGSDEDSLTGNWTGGARDTLGVNGGANFSFSQSGSSLGGTWELTFRTGSPANNGGTVAATVHGGSVSGELTSASGCHFSFTASRNGDHLAGSYAALDCSSVQKGTFDADRR
jgi:hypothetical protein